MSNSLLVKKAFLEKKRKLGLKKIQIRLGLIRDIVLGKNVPIESKSDAFCNKILYFENGSFILEEIDSIYHRKTPTKKKISDLELAAIVENIIFLADVNDEIVLDDSDFGTYHINGLGDCKYTRVQYLNNIKDRAIFNFKDRLSDMSEEESEARLSYGVVLLDVPLRTSEYAAVNTVLNRFRILYYKKYREYVQKLPALYEMGSRGRYKYLEEWLIGAFPFPESEAKTLETVSIGDGKQRRQKASK